MAGSDVAQVSRRGRRLRILLTVAALGTLAYGSVAGSNKLFPFGPMTQYAAYRDPNGQVASTTVWADTTAGTQVRVELNADGVGVKRADIENQLREIVADPSLLRTISTAQRRLHPDQPQFVRLYVRQTIYPLHDRVPGEPYVKTLATWTVTR